MTEKRFILDDCGTLIDMQTRDTFDYVSEVVELLNEQHEENQALKSDKTNLHRTMSKDRVRYNQFKDKVFCCLDNKIKLLKDCCMSNEVKILEELREEIIRND